MQHQWRKEERKKKGDITSKQVGKYTPTDTATRE